MPEHSSKPRARKPLGRAGRRGERPPPPVTVLLADPLWRRAVAAPAALVRRAARAALAAAAGDGQAACGVTVLLADDARLRALNHDFRGQDKPTNVLSFPAGPDGPRLGDVAIARETVLAEAAAEGKRPSDHLAHLVVHGVLHLCGVDHDTPARARRMERAETAILAGLGLPDPYRAAAAPPAAGRRRRR